MNHQIVSPCGIDCFNCEVYKENVTDELQTRVSASTNVPKHLITCEGCIDGNICVFLKLRGQSCKTLNCAESKGVRYCYECNDFPCSHLMPLADGANRFPQNIKLYNLCLMKKLGIEEWKKQAASIRKIYFTKPIAIGEGGCSK